MFYVLTVDCGAVVYTASRAKGGGFLKVVCQFRGLIEEAEH